MGSVRCVGGSHARIVINQTEVDACHAVCHSCGTLLRIKPNLKKMAATIPGHNVPEPVFVPPADSISVAEAAGLAGVSETVVKRWLGRKDVAGVKNGKTWHVSRSSLEAFLERPRGNGRPAKS